MSTKAVLPAGSVETASTNAGWLARRLAAVLESAGVTLNGPAEIDPRVHDPALYRRILTRGLTGLGEGYVAGEWDCADLFGMFTRLLRARAHERLPADPLSVQTVVAARLSNRQTVRRARRDVAAHYDQERPLFEATLDPRMVYSCGYWTWPDGLTAPDLAAAQEAKLDLICRKLGLEPGMTLLDIGCGWGGLCKWAAERYGVSCLGITLSREQQVYARQACGDLPVEIELRDYRNLGEQRFDRIASVGMLEHVGPRNYRAYFHAVARHLATDGLALIHSFITGGPQPSLQYREAMWFERYIFPGFVTPCMSQLGAALEADRQLILEDLQNVGQDYATTLLAWESNFTCSWQSDARLRRLYEPEADQFYRMWRYYLLQAAAGFASRRYSLWQMVLSPVQAPGGYRAVR